MHKKQIFLNSISNIGIHFEWVIYKKTLPIIFYKSISNKPQERFSIVEITDNDVLSWIFGATDILVFVIKSLLELLLLVVFFFRPVYYTYLFYFSIIDQCFWNV